MRASFTEKLREEGKDISGEKMEVKMRVKREGEGRGNKEEVKRMN